MTLKQFVTRCGTQEKAALAVGVSFTTINRWLNGRRKPGNLAVARLLNVGVKL